MKVLVLDPAPQATRYAVFPRGSNAPETSGRIDGRPPSLEAVAGAGPDVVAVRILHGGRAFRGPALATPESLSRLGDLVADAPLHLPPALGLLRACRHVFPDVPVVMLFETAFFADLPERERSYAIDPEAMRSLRLSRTGFHGLLHGAACARVVLTSRVRGTGPAPKILSICLESRPELAAAFGMRPVMVTGGATPLEGLPGETLCGDVDPGLVVALGKERSWGPEEIDRLLSRESGLSALAGRPVTLGEVLREGGRDLRLARAVFLHRLLLAGGAGAAALGGVDTVVFSGRYAAAAQRWARRLAGRVAVEFLTDPIEGVMAEAARAAAPGAAPA